MFFTELYSREKQKLIILLENKKKKNSMLLKIINNADHKSKVKWNVVNSNISMKSKIITQ
jgi:hypothetical protein